MKKRSDEVDADALADMCSRAGAVCGRGLLSEIERLRAIVEAVGSLRERVANRMMATAKVEELDACLAATASPDEDPA